MPNTGIDVWSSFLLAVLTAVYVALTYQMLRTNQRQLAILREQFLYSVRPSVLIEAFAFPGSPLFKLRIRNVGKSAAERLRLQIDRDFWALGKSDRNLRDFHVFRNVIDNFAPGSEIVFNLGVSSELWGDKFQGKCPTRFSISADYHYSAQRTPGNYGD